MAGIQFIDRTAAETFICQSFFHPCLGNHSRITVRKYKSIVGIIAGSNSAVILITVIVVAIQVVWIVNVRITQSIILNLLLEG